MTYSSQKARHTWRALPGVEGRWTCNREAWTENRTTTTWPFLDSDPPRTMTSKVFGYPCMRVSATPNGSFELFTAGPVLSLVMEDGRTTCDRYTERASLTWGSGAMAF
ncbi:hypothetical protein N7G274_006768 [Stereocaulon virgatum]|uniref:Uncharacterized protein n=1 Tax=Stereocaulon virgatum TaxID=373712 RepID=A0ABR4A383_9LECA